MQTFARVIIIIHAKLSIFGIPSRIRFTITQKPGSFINLFNLKTIFPDFFKDIACGHLQGLFYINADSQLALCIYGLTRFEMRFFYRFCVLVIVRTASSPTRGLINLVRAHDGIEIISRPNRLDKLTTKTNIGEYFELHISLD